MQANPLPLPHFVCYKTFNQESRVCFCVSPSTLTGAGAVICATKFHCRTMAASWPSLLASGCSAYLWLLIIYNVDYARADYENTWNLYYEPPCCTGAAAAVGHHLRHHKGKSALPSPFTLHISCCNFSLSKCCSGFSLSLLPLLPYLRLFHAIWLN